MAPIQSILIVGGGTAGWLTAGFLARTLGTKGEGGVAITLVESSDIGIIGVGEGTFPSIRGTLSTLGIDEPTFVRECSATFKQGIQFVDWVRAPGAQGPSAYFHPFSQPSQKPGSPELLPYWLLGGAAKDLAFADAVTMQKRVADARHGSKRLTDGDYLGPMNYAYHFDAGKFAGLLARHAKSLGVQHRIGTVEHVTLDATGAIGSVVTAEWGALQADLYIDCTGFRAELIGKALGSPFHSLRDSLFVDRALAMQVPYAQADAPIASYTISTAHEAGWTWDIGLQQRRGVGYVYSSRHTDDSRAEAVLRAHIGAAADDLTPRMLKLEVGYRDVHWIKNCVAVGLSGGFIEPLEASGIGLIETAAYLIGFLFPKDGNTEPVAKHFNSFMRQRYARVADFVKMHYCLTQRNDHAFWRDNTASESISETLREQLAMWRCRPPHRLDFVTDVEMYPPSSWQYVLYGMEFQTDLSQSRSAYPHLDAARQEFAMIQKMAHHAVADLPTHRALVDAMCARYAVLGRPIWACV